MEERDLDAADRIFRLAFGTYLGLEKPETFAAGQDYVRFRWSPDSKGALAAEVDEELAGSNFITEWGSVAYFGPLTVHPQNWGRKVANCLLERTLEIFEQGNTRHQGLYTFPQSTKHVHLYQKYGFWPRYLMALVSKTVDPPRDNHEMTCFSLLGDSEKEAALRASAELTDSVYEGLCLNGDIEILATKKLGESVLLWGSGKLEGLALCHCGEGTQAGPDTCHIKFAAVRPGAQAAVLFERLLDCCEVMAFERQLRQISTAVNTGCHEAYRLLLSCGYKTTVQGLAMHRPNEDGYFRPGSFVVSDWR